MRKLYLSIIIGVIILAIAGVTAGITTSFSKEAKVDKATKDTLAEKQITDAVYKASYCNIDYCEYCGQSSTGYGLGCVIVNNRVCSEYSKQTFNEDGTPTDEPVICLNYKTYTEKEKQDIQEKVNEKLKEIASSISEDNSKSAVESLGEGIYTIKEKK